MHTEYDQKINNL